MAGKNDLEERTLRFAPAIIEFVGAFPRNNAGDVIGRQPLKSGTSIGANYREANRAESRQDFIHKVGVVEKDTSESSGTRQPAEGSPQGSTGGCWQTDYWLEICVRSHIGESTSAAALSCESRELLAIFTTIGRKAKSS